LPTAVLAVAVSGGTLYAGGKFTRATNSGNAAVTVNGIAQWNGSGWSPLSPGMNGDVLALAVSGGTLYAGGQFTTAGDTNANYIAQWNGTNWSPLGPGMDWYVNALAVSGNTLYAGGAFDTAGGNPATYIAQWNGSSWSPLGSGIGPQGSRVSALAVSGGTLYAGGHFTTVGGKVSGYAAEAVLWPDIQSGPVPNRDGSMTLNCATATSCSSRLHAVTNLTPLVSWQPICTNVTGGLWQFTDTNTAGCKRKFYRLSTP